MYDCIGVVTPRELAIFVRITQTLHHSDTSKRMKTRTQSLEAENIINSSAPWWGNHSGIKIFSL